MEKETGVLVKGRATIDTRPPFRSVKEAVALFGERVLVGEIYAKQLKEMEIEETPKQDNVITTLGLVSAELEETKQNLQKAREEGSHMEQCIKTLKEELEQTKGELRKLKAAKDIVVEHPRVINPEIEELKFVENRHNGIFSNDSHYGSYSPHDLQKKKFVTFASPPSLTRELMHNQHGGDFGAAKLGRTPSFRREGRKKPVIFPIAGWLFPKKKRNCETGECGTSPSPKAHK